MKIIFNTGRLYTDEGQVITAIYTGTAIHFADHSRAVHGTIPCYAGSMTERELAQFLMHRYDRGAYSYTPHSMDLLMTQGRDMTIEPLKLRGL